MSCKTKGGYEISPGSCMLTKLDNGYIPVGSCKYANISGKGDNCCVENPPKNCITTTPPNNQYSSNNYTVNNKQYDEYTKARQAETDNYTKAPREETDKKIKVLQAEINNYTKVRQAEINNYTKVRQAEIDKLKSSNKSTTPPTTYSSKSNNNDLMKKAMESYKEYSKQYGISNFGDTSSSTLIYIIMILLSLSFIIYLVKKK